MTKKGLALSPILCDGMILQREVCNRICGTETLADLVTVSFMNTEYIVRVADNHDFCVELPPVTAGGPYSMVIKGSTEITISDILFGDVYLLSGQSNMELPIKRVLDVSEEEIRNTEEPTIRQYLIPATYNFAEPQKDIYKGQWKKACNTDLMDFSATGYFFAKEIKEAYQIPIGLIMTAVGGSCIEAWMNPVNLQKFGNYEETIEEFKNISYFNSFIAEQQNSAYEWLVSIEADEQKLEASDHYKEWDKCMVPSFISDYSEDEFSGSVYLCREIILDMEPTQNDAYIYMGSIIDSDKLWINGELVGSTEYRYPPRKYRINQGVLKKGINLITVRIGIHNGNGGTIKNKPYHLYCDGCIYNLEGEWYYRIGNKAKNTMPAVLFPPSLPTCFYNTAVVPLSKTAIKGVLWYQGESNTKDPVNYSDKFKTMVSEWRRLFGWEVPFIYVQLSNYREPLNNAEDTGWAELREQQRQNLSIPEVAMVVSMDVGEASDIHPQNKKEVGVRLSKAARYLIYHEPIVHSGPIPKNYYVGSKKVTIIFDYLENSEEEYKLNNFELAGVEGIFYEAMAIRKGRSVTLFCDEVTIPKEVRYAWSDCPTNINFYNNAGLPATGFRLELE